MTILKNAEETRAFGFSLGKKCRGGEVFLFFGPLGAGKTELIKGLARGLDYVGEVTSPTYTLLHEYRGGRFPLYHFDFYRLENPKAAEALGLEEYWNLPAVIAIEWPEKVDAFFPSHARRIALNFSNDGSRTIEEKEFSA